MDVLAGMRLVRGETTDFSALGADLSTWQRVRAEVRGGAVTLQVGDNPPFTTEFETDPGRVVGLRVRFEGAGAVDYVRMRDGAGTTVYEEGF